MISTNSDRCNACGHLETEHVWSAPGPYCTVEGCTCADGQLHPRAPRGIDSNWRGLYVDGKLVTSTAQDLFIVNADDWQGLYVDGKLVCENHRLGVYEVLEALGFKYESELVDDAWIEERSKLPENLSDVKLS